MVRTRFKKVILVAPDIFPEQLIVDYHNVKRVSSVNCIFPSIFELNPDLIVFDSDFVGKEMENTLRRIKANKFYHRIKIFCYKNTPDEKTDSLLKALGADHIIYREDLVKNPKSKNLFNTVNSIIDTSIIKLVASISN
jgi:hypothetical protein